MDITEHTLYLNAEKPFSFLHISDTHLCFADLRDGERKTELARHREKIFPGAYEGLKYFAQTAKKQGCFLAHTGDMIDFVSQKNLETAAGFCRENDVFLCAGNHEFSLFVGEAKEDKAYRDQSLERVQAAFTNDIRFAVKRKNGIDLVAVDNSYYLFDEDQLKALKRVCSNGSDVLLFIHTPLYTPELYAFMKRIEGENAPAYLCDVEPELMRSYPPERFIQQKADEITHETVEFIRGCENIRAIFTGHLHHDFAGEFGGKPQFVTGLNSARKINILPVDGGSF